MTRLVHFEIHAENPEQAAEFYSKVFGWEIKKWDGPMPYWLITTGPSDQPGINGGILKRMGAKPVEGQAVNAFVCTIDVPSLDEYVIKATSNGGSIAMPKMPVPGMGWLAYCKDPEGNIFGMMQNDPLAK